MNSIPVTGPVQVDYIYDNYDWNDEGVVSVMVDDAGEWTQDQRDGAIVVEGDDADDAACRYADDLMAAFLNGTLSGDGCGPMNFPLMVKHPGGTNYYDVMVTA
jgi:hypothetical protein